MEEEKGFEEFLICTLYKKNLIMKQKRSKHGGKRIGSGAPSQMAGGPSQAGTYSD
jgi:hypothetical protein